ncbi:MAG TPA: hypothetical protein VJZ26_16385 [Blastocatellia bacterium]|nr:hypothetical protein [Blastocatellia bacterium]
MTYKKSKLAKSLVVLITVASFAGIMITSRANISSTEMSRARAPLNTASAQTVIPTKDHSVYVKRLKEITPDGNALLILRFHNTKVGRQLKLPVYNRTILLHDDGTAGDEVADDGRLSAIVSLNFSEIAANQSRIKAAQSRSNSPLTIPTFDGRVKVGDQEMGLPLSSGELLPGQEIELEAAAAPTGIDPARSLLITDVRVVEDPTRTYNPCTDIGTKMGKWTFGYLMTQMANQAATGIDPAKFTRRWLANWEATQVVNGWGVPPRPSVRNTVIIPWENASGGPGQPLDLSIAPFRLLAIVNRIDLRGSSGYQTSNAGEARFVFGVIDRRDPNGCCVVSEMSVILEYGIDIESCEKVRDWAQQWINLSSLALGSPAYNAALEAITEQFAKAGAAPRKVNGSALNQLRTNEFLPPITGDWELREFKLTPGLNDPFAATGDLIQTTVKQTPDRVLNNRPTLSDFINANCGTVNAGTHVVPLAFPRNPADAALPNPPAMLGGSSFVPPGAWNAPGLACGPNPPGNARFQFSFATCSGCHQQETATPFYHIRPTPFGTPATLSLFLSGPLTVNDPFNGTPRNFDELTRRAIILDQIAHQPCPIAETVVTEPLIVTPEGEARQRPSSFVH